MQSNEDIQFRTILDEANAHYTTGRYVDAAKTFEHLSSVCVKNENFEDMLYFTYRALKAWEFSNKNENIIKLYQRIGILSLKFSTKNAMDLAVNCTDSITKAKYYNIIQNNLKFLNEDERRIPIVNELIQLYENILIVTDNYNNKKDLFEKIIDLADDIDNINLKNKYTMILAKSIEKEGDWQLKNSSFDAEEIANRLYMQSINILKNLDNSKSERMRNKLNKKIDKNLMNIEN